MDAGACRTGRGRWVRSHRQRAGLGERPLRDLPGITPGWVRAHLPRTQRVTD